MLQYVFSQASFILVTIVQKVAWECNRLVTFPTQLASFEVEIKGISQKVTAMALSNPPNTFYTNSRYY